MLLRFIAWCILIYLAVCFLGILFKVYWALFLTVGGVLGTLAIILIIVFLFTLI